MTEARQITPGRNNVLEREPDEEEEVAVVLEMKNPEDVSSYGCCGSIGPLDGNRCTAAPEEAMP